ncbi:MAG: hypothetical protein HS104_35765 [Polyangiaceae bacterium]|nr:hypothetical protein [Polyangiaceae bacterium]MCL4750390.1 hypothetical protein [Myxococcales bacterium]
MRLGARFALSILITAGVATLACGSKRGGGYSPNNPNFGGGSGNGGSGNASGNGGSGNASGSGGLSNFGGGGPGCDATKAPSEDACVIHESFAVFVSPKGDDIDGNGTRAKPYKSIDQAIGVAANEKKRVYACATSGSFDGQLTLDSFTDGVSLYGGFDCDTWDYQSGTKTQLLGPSNGVIEIQDLVIGTSIEDFDVTAANATSPGAGSMGIVVGSSKNVKLRRLKVTAGTGATGVAGYTTPGVADSGKNGNPGKNQCNADPKGGAQTVSGCGFPESTGGWGGVAGVGTGTAGSGTDGEPNLGGGLGGVGEDPTLPGGWSCGTVGAGKPGKAGADGPNGEGSKSPGKVTASGWISSAGGFGTNGGNGQGGGGGGAAKAPSSCGTTGPNPPTGASGGGGGSGGCGGIGGEGGKGGGASIALVVFESGVTITDSDFVSVNGGKGGAGGVGQLGGSGSSGAPGGAGACAGAGGAKGGNGGHGGGGAGGPSIGIAWKGTKPARTGGNIKVATIAATGGADGAGQTSGAGAGALGLLVSEQEFQ